MTMEGKAGGRRRSIVGAIGRVPATAAFLVVFLTIGAVTGSLWSPVTGQDWFPIVAYGIPSFEAGRWWTPITGTFFAMEPWHYVTLIPFIVFSLGWLEWVRGTRVAMRYMVLGQLGSVLGAAAIIAVLRTTAWAWPQELATVLDVGPSGGLFVALAAAIVTLRSPWRLRLRLALGALLLVTVLFIGTLADLEHLVGAAFVLFFLYGGRPVRPSGREWRLLASVALLSTVAVQLIVAFVPTDGPFGQRDPGRPDLWSIAIDTVVVLLIANGVRQGRRVAWVVGLVLAGLNVALGLLLLVSLPAVADQLTAVETELAIAVLWLAVLILLILGRRAFRVPFRRGRRFISTWRDVDEDSAVALMREHGSGTLGWMATWPDMRYVFSADRDAVLAMQRHGLVALGLGDPFAAPADLAPLLADFDARCTASGLVPCVFSASEAVRAAAPQGWRSIVVAEDALIDLPGLELAGKRWQPVRGAMNRAERDGIAFRLVSLAEQPWAILAQVRAISEEWVGDKDLPEMRFTLGGVDEALAPEVRTALAVDAEGSVHGVLSWLPVYAPGGAIRGWTLDLMRRRDDGFAPVIEFLIASSMLAFRDEGAAVLSLSGAPLTNSELDEPSMIQQVVERLGKLLEPAYGFQSLHKFKRKFNPREEPLYLLYRDEADLPAIGVALVRAYLPDASAMDFARAGLSLIHR